MSNFAASDTQSDTLFFSDLEISPPGLESWELPDDGTSGGSIIRGARPHYLRRYAAPLRPRLGPDDGPDEHFGDDLYDEMADADAEADGGDPYGAPAPEDQLPGQVTVRHPLLGTMRRFSCWLDIKSADGNGKPALFQPGGGNYLNADGLETIGPRGCNIGHMCAHCAGELLTACNLRLIAVPGGLRSPHGPVDTFRIETFGGLADSGDRFEAIGNYMFGDDQD